MTTTQQERAAMKKARDFYHSVARQEVSDHKEALEGFTYADQEIAQLLVDFAASESERADRDEAALQCLYDETADYIRINNLGDIHHNRSMQMARDALTGAPPGAVRQEE
jgi:Na+-transporting NADH:ubiquinone oxidoreductase subunit NqrC